ncbi:FliM/FliN family flagellar motor C-terminal domain-containing protein [Hyphomonas sp. WL0036]|uniref:FliM/FliN family flagellar motor switch protein n=1 Tax=Hyphomonas sediminis TaxID=2866160 RepID=UPI001C80CD63|nr:FliM/FliN family flagellar motor C-terminal domain-containing protein [Hyphomonas sediminis]MBY9065777.1 FliM/FliN family flagellar motor C-terminal domain-containing protein [Hyphomonas sediminis]
MAQPEKAAEFDGAERRDPSARNSYRRSIYSVPVTVTVSIGQKRLSVQEILELQPDSVIALTSRIDDPVDLYIGDKLIAKGELVETEDGQIAVKIVEISEKAADAE